LEDGFSEGINSFGYFNLDDDLLFVIDQQRFDCDEDGFG
jgi:hypothetical protein